MKLTNEAEQALRRIEDGKRRLSPEQVVEAARPEESPLHEYFDWDDSEAAEKWRIEQARELLKRVKIEVVYQERTIRTVGYVRDPKMPAEEAGYIATMSVRKADAATLLLAELSQISGLVERAHGLAMARAQELPEGFAEKVQELAKAVKRLEGML